MFERYTERARRGIFFARYEASQFGSTTIETEHLLLGLIREDKNLTNRFLRNHSSIESIRKEIEGRTIFLFRTSANGFLPMLPKKPNGSIIGISALNIFCSEFFAKKSVSLRKS